MGRILVPGNRYKWGGKNFAISIAIIGVHILKHFLFLQLTTLVDATKV
jgi:hypothetical protein